MDGSLRNTCRLSLGFVAVVSEGPLATFGFLSSIVAPLSCCGLVLLSLQWVSVNVCDTGRLTLAFGMRQSMTLWGSWTVSIVHVSTVQMY